MSSSFDKFQKRRLITSYFSVILSVFLVLFLLGALALFIVNSKKLSDDFKEGIAMSVYFKDEAKDTSLANFTDELKASKYAKTYKFVSKDAAAKEHTDIIGEDFLEFLWENTLQNSYDVLNEFGNMSSPTILFVLKRILDELQQSATGSKQIVFGAAFGPGLTMETFIVTYG